MPSSSRGSIVATVLTAFLLVSAFAGLAGQGSHEGMQVFVTFPAGEYTVGSDVTATVHVYQRGAAFDPDTVTLQVGTGQRSVTTTRTATGVHEAQFTVLLGDLDNADDVELYAYAMVADPHDSATHTSEVRTTWGSEFHIDLRPNYQDQYWKDPGDSASFYATFTHNGTLVEPDAGSVKALLEHGDDDDLPMTMVGLRTGYWGGSHYLAPPITESGPYTVLLEANYTDGSSRTHYANTMLRFNLDFANVWTDPRVVTTTGAEVDVYVTNLWHAVASGVSISMDYSYWNTGSVLTTNTATGTTDSDGKAALALAYPDIGAGSYVHIKGTATKASESQAFSGRFHPTDPAVPATAFHCQVTSHVPIALDTSVTIDQRAYNDGTPLASQDISYYLASDHQVIATGTATTDSSGHFRFTATVPSAAVVDAPPHLEVRYDANISSQWETTTAFLPWEDWSHVPTNDRYFDGRSTLTVDSYVPGDSLTVTFDHPDADGGWENCTIWWAPYQVGAFLETDMPRMYRANPSHEFWGHTMIAPEWSDGGYHKTFTIPPFIPADAPISVMGRIEFDEDLWTSPSMALATAGQAPNEPPTVAITSPAPGEEVSGTVTVQGTASDDNGVSKVEIAIDDGGWLVLMGTDTWSYQLPTEAMDDGTHTLKVRSFDDELFSDEVTIEFVVDNTGPVNEAPTVAITSPSAGATVSGTIIASGTASDDEAVEAVSVRIDGGDWTDATGTAAWTFEVDTTGLDEGDHTVEARSFDGTLYSTIAAVTFQVDQGVQPTSDPPTVSIYRPSSPAWNTQVIWTMMQIFSGLASDDNGVESVFVSVDGGPWELAKGTERWAIEVDTTNMTVGTHNVSARAYDGEQYSIVDFQEYDVDPDLEIFGRYSRMELSFKGPTHNSTYNPTKVVKKGTYQGHVFDTIHFSSDVKSDPLFIEYRLGDSGEWSQTEGIMNWKFELRASEIPSGCYTLYIRGFDGYWYSNVLTMNVEIHYDDPLTKSWCESSIFLVTIFAGVMVVQGRSRWGRDRKPEWKTW